MSPTSEKGKITKSTPFGSEDHPFNPAALRSGAEGRRRPHGRHREEDTSPRCCGRPAEHEGSAFVEIYQNCNVFNDAPSMRCAARPAPQPRSAPLDHGKPISFGPRRDAAVDAGGGGVTPRRRRPVDACRCRRGGGTPWSSTTPHHETELRPGLTRRLAESPTAPTPIGVLRAVKRAGLRSGAPSRSWRRPTPERRSQNVDELLRSGDT